MKNNAGEDHDRAMSTQPGTREYLVNESQSLRVLDLLSFVLCTYISFSLSGNVFAGSIAYMLGFGIENYFRLHTQREFRKNFRGLLPLLILFSIILPVIGIITLRKAIANLPAILAAAAWFAARSAMTHWIILRFADDRQRSRRIMGAAQFSAVALLLPLLGFSGNWLFAAKITAISLIYPLAVLTWLYRAKHKKLVIKANYAATRVFSYRLYQAQILCSNTAMYLSLMMYMGMFALMPRVNNTIPPIEVWVALAATITFVAGRLIRRGILKNMEKTTLFLIGGSICLLAHFQLNASYVAFKPGLAWFWSLVQAAGLAMMMLLATYMQEDMRLVLELAGDADEASDKTYRSFAQQVAFYIAGILACVEMYFLDYITQNDWPDLQLNALARPVPLADQHPAARLRPAVDPLCGPPADKPRSGA